MFGSSDEVNESEEEKIKNILAYRERAKEGLPLFDGKVKVTNVK
jgi:hypothetical protein